MTARAQFRFFHPLRVRWSECDQQSIVFNVNYFLYCDVVERRAPRVNVRKGTRETAPLDADFIRRILAFETTPPERGPGTKSDGQA